MSDTPAVQTERVDERTDVAGGDAAGGVAAVARVARTGLGSGLFAAVAGLVSLVRLRRALRDGSGDGATRNATMAVFWIGVAMTQWGRNRADRRSDAETVPGSN